MRYALLLLALLSIGTCGRVVAQILPFQTYTTKEGLPSNHITAVLQDGKGYLWVGTDNGLSVYDGTEFRNFTTSDGLPNLYINEIIESRTHPGTLWIGTIAGGLVELSNGHFSVLHVGDNDVNSLYEDEDGTLWCATGTGNYRIKDGSGSYVSATDVHGSSIEGLKDKSIAILTARTMTRHHLDGSVIGRRLLALHDHEFVSATLVDPLGVLWAFSSEGTLLEMKDSIDAYHHFQVPFRPSPHIPSQIMDDDRGSLWMTTPHGILIMNKADATFRVLRDFGGPMVEPSGPILLDREGIIWVGTYANGLMKLSDQRISRITLGQVNDAAYNLVACSDTNGHIWIATTTALCEVVRSGNNKWSSYHHPFGPGMAGHSNATVLIDHQNRLWVGPTANSQIPFSCYAITEHPDGASRLNPVMALRPGVSARQDMGLTFTIDRFQRGWFSLAPWGVALVDLRKKKLVHTFTESSGMPQDALRALLVDRTARVWCGTWAAGMAVAQAGTDTFSMVRDYAGLPGAGVRSLHEDREGSIWIGTRYGGLVRYRNGHYTGTSVSDGLQSNAIWSIAETDHRIWCGTDVGLEIVDKESCRPLPPKTELLGKRVYACGAYKNEYVWCVLANELVVFEQPENNTHTPPAPAYIRSFAVNGVMMSPDSAHELEHNQNSCTIDFVGVSFRDERNVRYRYRLLGHDSVWTKPVKEHTVTFASLRPGTYRFEVRAINGDGAVTIQPAAISFVIVPPVWLRSWFVAGVVLLMASIIYGLFRYRLYHLMKMERLKLRIASDLHDDVGTNLSSIMLASQIIESELPQSSEQRTHLAELRTRAGMTRDMLKDIVWLLNPGNDSVDDFILKLKDIAQRQLMGIPCTFTISGEYHLKGLGLEFKRNVVLFFKEALTNVVKHSGASAVEVVLTLRENQFSLTIRDNGRGFDVHEPTKGNGLTNLRMRAGNIAGSIEIESAKGRGTTIRLDAKITYTRSVRWRKNRVY